MNSITDEFPVSHGGLGGWITVPYSREIFHFHRFNFYNAICFQIIMGAPVILLAKDLGANSVILGVIAAFSPLMTILQLPAARYLGRHGYRSFALAGWGARSVFIVLSACIPLLTVAGPGVRLAMLLGCLFFFNALRGISSASFLPWMTGLVGASIRGRFLSVDQTFANAGSLAAMLVSALLMRGSTGPWHYSLVLWIAVAAAVMSICYMRLVPDVRQEKNPGKISPPVPFSGMMANAPFRSWILFNLLFVTVSGGLSVFPVEYLRVRAQFSPSLIYGLSAFTFLGPMLILQLLGRRVDRIGGIPVMRASVLVFTVVLAVWFAMSAGCLPPSWWLVMLLNLAGGAAMAGFSMANGHLSMAVVPESGKNHYFAMATVITSVAAGIVPLCWGWLLDTLGGLDLAAGPFHLGRHSMYFLGIFLLSAFSFASIRVLSDPSRSKQGGDGFSRFP